jgi:hypothetical protein
MKSVQGWRLTLRHAWMSLARGPRQPLATRPARLHLETLEDRTVLSPTVHSPLVAPIPSNDVQTADGSTPLVLDGPSYFGHPDGDLVVNSLHLTTNPAHGQAVVDPSTGSITYTAATGFHGTDTVGFVVTDVNGLTSDPAFVNVIVTGPTATDDNIDTDAGHPVSIPVLANDASPVAPLDPASVHLVNGPSHGQAIVDPSTGNFTYTSVAGFSGTDIFTYTVADTNGAVSNVAQVSVVVNRPQANDDFASTSGTTPVVISVLDNDTDPDGPGLLVASSVAVLSSPAHGGVSVDPTTGNVTYTANAGFSGNDSFTYTVMDINGAVSNAATVTVAVQQSSSGTVINPDTIDTDAGNPVVIDVLANDSSPVGFNPTTVAVPTQPLHGSTRVDPATGAITYTPVQGFAGTDSFTYTVQDSNGVTQGPGAVSVVVNRPKANDDFSSTDAGNPVVISVLANDTDPDGPGKLVPSSVAIVAAPAHGTATVDSSTGAVTYTPAAGFTGTDMFQYTVADVNGAVSNSATVNVVVNRPTANDDFGTTDAGHPITLDVLANDTDPDGPGKLVPSSVAVVSGPANGTVSVDPTTGQITYTSVAGFSGTDTFTYTVMDVNNAVSNPATVSVVVNRPTANPDVAGTTSTPTGGVPVVLHVVSNDTDPDGNQFLDPHSVTIVSGPSHGSATVDSSTGDVTYTPAAGFSGTDTFQYTIADTNGAVSNPATDSIIVLGTGIGKTGGIVSLPPQPGPSSSPLTGPNAAFVDEIYSNLLGRHATSDPGMAGWVGLLQQTGSLQAVVQGIIHSAEYRGLEVTSYYQNFLGRTPTTSEVQDWVHAFQAGATEQQVAVAFFTSPEFQGMHSSNGDFVNALYNDLLGRNPETSAPWQALLNSGAASRGQVALAVMNSTEALADTVQVFYGDFLGRGGSSAETAVWLGFLGGNHAQLDAVALSFLASTEFHQGVISGKL